MTNHLVIKPKKKRNLKFTTKQDSPASRLALTRFSAFGKGMQLISKPPYAATQQQSGVP